ncbi:hypothetical protein N7492_001826 [Penicillium capsulatum]|uniref:Uncharacterized protein n=1 Tax=Penicillium capsulatum TaxID=69766 RepID=A0A9W9M079_9EURO|nr:hypothetical protein N7492_001826 [Penicillium capsulatum]KAJ6129125.1 hypothetical protein N7512_001905 [Penicillium capsulatum]
MWASKGLAAQKLGVLFTFVSSIADLKLFPAIYQSALVLLLIIRGWDDERSGYAQPLSPEMEKLDPTLRIWLCSQGFTKDRDILRLAQYSGGSQVHSLLKEIREAQPTCTSGETISHAILPETKTQEEAQAAQFLSEEMSRTNTPLESNTVKGKEIEAEHGEEEKRANEAWQTLEGGALPPSTNILVSDDSNEDLVTEDLLDDAVSKASVMVEPRVPEQSAAVPRPKTEINKLSWKRSLDLLTGYHFQGTERKKSRFSSYSFCIYYILFYIHEAPPDCKLCFVKAELAPPGERHPNAYATKANETDPGARFALRVAIHDANGEETFLDFRLACGYILWRHPGGDQSAKVKISFCPQKNDECLC